MEIDTEGYPEEVARSLALAISLLPVLRRASMCEMLTLTHGERICTFKRDVSSYKCATVL